MIYLNGSSTILMVTILIILFVLANTWSESSSATIVYTNSEGSGPTLQMHWPVWAFDARQWKNLNPKSWYWISYSLNWKINEMLPTIYKATSDLGPYSLHFPKYYISMKYLMRPWFSLSANIILSILQNRHISKYYRVPPDAAWCNT